MQTIILLSLFLGIVLGALLLTASLLYFLKIKCPKCKELKPLQQIFVFQFKTRTITGQPCQRCQRPKPKIDIEL